MTETAGTTRNRTGPEPPSRNGGWLLGVAIVLAAANLRPLVASVGPVLDDIRVDLGLSATVASFLTALPILCFGAGAVVAPAASRRFGPDRVLAAMLGGTTLGLVLRMGPNTVTLFAGTLLAGGAIAIVNVLLPAMVKQEFPERTGPLMGLYISVMMVMAAVAAAATVPFARAFGDDWRAGLGVWAVPAAAALVGWVAVIIVRHRGSVPYQRSTQRPGSLLRDAVAWQVTALMGLQSLGFYALMSWLPSVYRSYGMDPASAGALLSVMLVIGVPTALFFPSVLTRARNQSGWAVVTAALNAAGLLGVLIAPLTWSYVWAGLLGMGMGSAFPLVLTLVVLRTRSAQDAAQLSAMSQSAGYAVGAVGPFLFGFLRDLTAGWRVPLILLLVVLIPQGIIGFGAGRALFVREGTAR